MIIRVLTKAKRKTLSSSLALALALCVSPMCATSAIGKDDAGKKKADEACAACHGAEGNKPISGETPRLGGQQYGYLVQALYDYRKGTRANPVMSAIAKPLTDNEIRDLAGYFSRQQGLVTKR